MLGVLFVGLGLLLACGCQAPMSQSWRASALRVPPRQGHNDFYTANRDPLQPNPLIKLPIGAVTPKGWLREQLVLMTDGFSGRLPEVSEFVRTKGNAWLSPRGEGESPWEEVPYWVRGFGDLGYVLKDERVIREAKVWIDAALAGQREDGYFGPRKNWENHDVWPNMIMLNALQSYYEATEDPRVLGFMSRYFRWQLNIPREQLLPRSWQKIRGGDNLESIYWLYNRTGEPWLLDLAKIIHERTIRWDKCVADWHGVNICQGFREPATYWLQSGLQEHLDATERDYEVVMALYGQAPGGMFGADENCRPGYHGPQQGAETCSMAELMHSDQLLLAFTGHPLWADRCEDVAFNSLPASMTPDLKGLHYLTAPNMPQLDQKSKSPYVENGGNMLAYDPFAFRCCQHNAVMGWPYYAEHLWMATRDNGLAAVLYVACSVKAKVADGVEVTIDETTNYPFDETVSLKVSAPRTASFPLYLRIPQWCEGATVSVNGQRVAVETRPLSYVRIERAWANGDTVRLELPMHLKLAGWPTNADSVSISRGPLAYSLKIGERWQRFGGTDKWPAFEVLPTTPWNYGLVLDEHNPLADFKVVKKSGPLAAQPFTPDAAPIQLTAKGRRIPNWKLNHLGLIAPLQASPAKTDLPVEDITLIPMGCARLRLCSFPTVDSGPEAVDWKEPAPPRHEASYHHDDMDAVSDGLAPADSRDRTMPRLTWWPHEGSTEWLTYKLDRPRKVGSCEVYWYINGNDDTSVLFRPPQSWRLYYRDGEQWQEVSGASGYGVALDQFNRVTFKPVETRELKIEVQLQKGCTGGMLEWRIGD